MVTNISEECCVHLRVVVCHDGDMSHLYKQTSANANGEKEGLIQGLKEER
jgi:hypothetical protein